MIEGRPHLLVVGGADTGRAPLLVALLRHKLGDTAVVLSAGVLGHAGEPADQHVQLALDHLNLTLHGHVARVLDAEIIRLADLILAVDQGSARIARMRTSQEVVTISELAATEEIPDPHHMPLGVWVAATRDYQAQIATILPLIRSRLRLGATASPVELAPQQRPAAVAAPSPPLDAPSVQAVRGANPRDEHIERVTRLLDTARLLPEIVDWTKLAREASDRLRALAALAEPPDDLTPAAAAMLIGILCTLDKPGQEPLMANLQQVVQTLQRPMNAEVLAASGALLRDWWNLTALPPDPPSTSTV